MHPDDVEQTEGVNVQQTLVQSEERVTGSISWVSYVKYFRFAGSIFWIPAIIILVLLSQVASGESNEQKLGGTHWISCLQLVITFSLAFGQVAASMDFHKRTTWRYMRSWAWLRRCLLSFSLIFWRTFSYPRISVDFNSRIRQICGVDCQSGNVQRVLSGSATIAGIILRHYSSR